LEGKSSVFEACYTRELATKPTLAGTVSTQFFITPNGTVGSANASGVDPAVANCIADAIKSLEFTKPTGGGGVQVNQPMTFRSNGEIGTGRYGTIGHGAGTGAGDARGRTAAVPTVSIGQPNVEGDLDKAIVRRYIKRDIQKIQYCYEKELLAKPTLSGTVVTQFSISGTGSVMTSKATGVDPAVSGCIENVIKGIEFPKPTGGGTVQVNYPLTFRPAGS
jgi:hypothetical protein